ncbi:MAG: endonuclease domain-containing protein [Nanoarchaeota archaeon]|nr:endonuclease domain-containing protein [Nanoarchaeota archaeon]
MEKITEDFLQRCYHKEKKSTRKIASELGVGKTTIEYYLKKFNIKRRTKTEANKLHSKESNWIRGLNKKKDIRVKKLSERIKLAYIKKRQERFREIEKKFGQPMKEIINNLYWEENLTQEQIAKKIGYDKKRVIELMRGFKILKRPKYQYISSLKGEKHSMFGRTWEKLYGKEGAKKRKKIHSDRFRELTIKRLENNEFPFFDTKIEKKMAKELVKKNIPFVKQFKIDNKFVCDFAIPPLKIIIECDGDYWHANPKLYNKHNPEMLNRRQIKNIQRDKFKDKYLSKKGWIVLRFFESDIKLNTARCVKQIEKTIQSKTEELKKIKSPIDSLMGKKEEK